MKRSANNFNFLSPKKISNAIETCINKFCKVDYKGYYSFIVRDSLRTFKKTHDTLEYPLKDIIRRKTVWMAITTSEVFIAIQYLTAGNTFTILTFISFCRSRLLSEQVFRGKLSPLYVLRVCYSTDTPRIGYLTPEQWCQAWGPFWNSGEWKWWSRRSQTYATKG